MQVQFMFDEPTETLCFHYLHNQTNKSKQTILNSILMQCSTSKDPLSQIFHLCKSIVDQSSSQQQQSVAMKQCLKNMSELLVQFINKMPTCLRKIITLNLLAIIQYNCGRVWCALSANNIISLLRKLVLQLNQRKQTQFYTNLTKIQQMLMNSKMHIGSYRQSTRQQLYDLLFLVIQNKQKQLTKIYVEKIMKSIEDEKDPRNMPIVLQIYLYLLNNTSKEQLLPLTDKLFENLEMYYPIDFEGDASKHNISLSLIASLLDQCLAHEVFQDHLFKLLKVKMAASPISKFISTFMLTPKVSDGERMKFWMNLLLKTNEEEFLQQDYEGSQYELSDLIVELLKRLTSSTLSIEIYQMIIKWMDGLLIQKIFNGNDNDKYAGRIMEIVQKVCKKCNEKCRCLIKNFIVHKFIDHKKSQGDIIYKMGMLIPVLEQISIDPQITAILILSLSQIFHQIQQPQPKLLALKIFMLLARQNSLLVRQLNVLPSILLAITDGQSQPNIIKSFVDYIVEIHSNDKRIEETVMQITNKNIFSYAVVTLALKNSQPSILQTLNHKIEKQNLLEIMKKLKLQGFTKLFALLNCSIIVNDEKTLMEIEMQFIKKLQSESQKQLIDLKEKCEEEMKESKILNIFMWKRIWRRYVCQDQQMRINIKNMIEESLVSQCQDFIKLGIKCEAFFNKTMQANKKDIQINVSQQNNYRYIYQNEIKSLLPISQSVSCQSLSKQSLQPTIVHYLWKKYSSSSQYVSLLIPLLPTFLLNKEADRILPYLLSQQDISTIDRVFMSLPEHIVANDILIFLVKFVEEVGDNTEVRKAVSAHSILDQALKRAEEESQIKEQLLRFKGKILVALEERIIHHRKRRVRQSGRKIFSALNMLK